ncbi:putative response regulator receiver protein [Moniliophthora roreri MCA 2997]|uniref:Response regulator receiver protein n=1 Tax=Moniliophthora roreri (strain MCA 2997) TaxID=1381753 RepID=V2X0Y1_MONRO|nr:putative response regulator receiver protein [Moniliophthora roreri MCA 2997]
MNSRSRQAEHFLPHSDFPHLPPQDYHQDQFQGNTLWNQHQPHQSLPHPTSSSREELYQIPIQPRIEVKREPQNILPEASKPSSNKQESNMEDSMPATSDFVKKLYKMLEDKSFQHVVCWGPAGDCFVVKDMNEFTKSILPRLFKHSNFASFVRQLNKYDFHKVKNTDDNTFGEHAWTFRHPDFHADRREALENIKRKVPTSRKSQSNNAASTTRPLGDGQTGRGGGSGSPGPTGYYGAPSQTGMYPDSYQISALQAQIDRLTASQEEMSSHIRSLERNIGGLERNLGGLERNYHEVLLEMVGFQRNMAQQDSVMQGLIEWVLRGGGGKGKRPALPSSSSPPLLAATSSSSSYPSSSSQQQAGPSSAADPNSRLSLSSDNPFVPVSLAQRLINPQYRAYPADPSNESMGRTALMKMNEISRRAEGVLNGTSGYSNGSYSGPSPADNVAGGPRPPSRLWTAAANAGLINSDGSIATNGSDRNNSGAQGPGPGGFQDAAPIKINSRQEALERIEELQKMRPASANYLSNAAARLVNAMDTFNNIHAAQAAGLPPPTPTGLESRPSPTESSSSAEEMVMPTPARQQPDQGASSSMGKSESPSGINLPWIPPIGSYNDDMGNVSSTSTSPASQGSPPGSNAAAGLNNPFPDYTTNHQGLQVYTVGHLMPKSAIDDMNGNWSFDTGMMDMLGSGQGSFNEAGSNGMVGSQEARADGSPIGYDPMSSSQPSDPSSSSGSAKSSQKLSVRRSTFVPGWTVSPRVLLVDDDAVSRKLSSKFLQVFGCKIDVAVDGVGAVNKMNLEKYDLVLMDIVMPKLDGVSATSLIRKFDHMTPIISMTSNAKPNEIMTYYSSGMNDILPKPFTKQGLLDMLEKHLMHLKVIQQMSRIPRSVGIPPLSDAGFEQAMTSQAALVQSSNQPMGQNMASSNNSMTPFDASLGMSGDSDENMGRLNPLAGMGLTDEQYNMILAGLVSGESFAGSMSGMDSMNFDGSSSNHGQKRSTDDDNLDGRAGKRSRFEVIE